ncbi:hypothetical protein GCM10027343_10430 [Noviherbaspirillum agri]
MLLAMALLFAQWSGFAHRIDHATWQQEHVYIGPVEAEGLGDTESRHSCVAFDAAAVADAITLPHFIAPLLASTEVLALWAAFSSWDAPPSRPFCPRAPPRA